MHPTAIVDALRAAGIDAYLPGRAPGRCPSPHAVVTDGGRFPTGRTTGRRIYLVTCYVPEQTPAALHPLIAQTADALIPLRGLQNSGSISEPYFDEEKHARAATIEYYILCSL